jgi:secondary thiamine-phosphate synthase enzyme
MDCELSAHGGSGRRPHGSGRFGVVKVHQDTISVSTKGRGLYDLSQRVRAVVDASGVTTGLCTVFVQHTSASLVIQENADPAVGRDMEKWIERIAPEDARAYEHDDEGPDDMPAHLRSAITKTSEVVPVTKGRLALGTWQAIYLWEHRRAPHTRTIVVHVQGVEN